MNAHRVVNHDLWVLMWVAVILLAAVLIGALLTGDLAFRRSVHRPALKPPPADDFVLADHDAKTFEQITADFADEEQQ